jgi:transcription elongation factor Elf1
MEAAMERLKFECPNTGRMVDVGIESEITSLLRIRQNAVHAQCAVCGQRHEWLVRDAQLARAA